MKLLQIEKVQIEFDLSQKQIFFNKKRAKCPLEKRIVEVLLIFECFFDQMSESESFNVC